jgi:DHA1 family tetracycline resistance protein-like MFS transporter
VIKHLKTAWVTTSDFFTLPLRPSVVIYAGLLWGIPGAMVNSFRSLYLVSLGLSNSEVGFYSFIFIPLGLTGLWVSGYLTDTWGRKKTLFLFDALSWGGYCLCLTFASNKWWAVTALFFFAFNLGSGPPYQCLLIEGVPETRRAKVYAVLQISNLAPALLFLPLLGGYWEGRQGLTLGCHQMFGFFTVMAFLGLLTRLLLLPHSGIYEKTPATWKHGFIEGFEQYENTFRQFFKKTAALPFLCSRILDEWIIATWVVYASLYYVQHLGLQDTLLAVLTQVGAYVGCGLLFFFTPRLSPTWMRKLLGIEQFFGMAALLVLLIPTGGFLSPFVLCLISVCLGAAGSSFYFSVTNALWMNLIGEKERAKVVAVSVTIFQLAVWVLGTLSAFLYGHYSPAALLICMIGARMVNFFLLRRVSVALQSPDFKTTGRQ